MKKTVFFGCLFLSGSLYAGTKLTPVSVSTVNLTTSATFFYQTGSSELFRVGASTVAVFSSTGTALLGTTTNNAALAGWVGESTTSYSGSVAFGASGVYKDFCTLNLTAGDWDVSALLVMDPASATSIASTIVGISDVAGNSGSGLVNGDNQAYFQPPSSGNLSSAVVPSYRISINSTTRYYLKVFATYGTSAPNGLARLTARRVR